MALSLVTVPSAAVILLFGMDAARRFDRRVGGKQAAGLEVMVVHGS